MAITFKDHQDQTRTLIASATPHSWEREATVDDLAAAIVQFSPELHKELAEKAQAEGEKLSPEKRLQAGGPFELFSMLASQSRGLLRQSGVRNYLEIGFEDPLGKLTVTIQKAEGETPGNRAARFDQLRKDAASAMRAAVALLESGHATEAAKLLADALPKVDADGLPPGAAEYLERLLRKQKASDAFRDTLADIPAENAPYTAASDGKEEP